MGFLSRLRNIKIQVNPSQEDLVGGPEAAAALAARDLATRPLLGPAGEHVYGTGSGRAATVHPPAASHAERSRQIQHEWARREAARAPYLAPERHPVVFTRIATRSGDAGDDIAAHLASSGLSARPDLVYGISRVPDHIGRSATSSRRRYEEWDVVHAATEGLAPSPPPTSTFLDARQRWVARASGEPTVLDEDLAVALLQAAGVGPERCLGIARVLATRAGGGGDSSSPFVKMAVVGVQAWVPSDAPVLATAEQLAAAAPIVLSPGPPPGVHVEVLNWVAVAKAIHPRTGVPFLVPSPFPYLPSTPQELLQAYLGIVGVRPADCYSAQVTIDVTKDVLDREDAGWFTATSTQGERQPCVDGTDRPRLAGAARVVVAYRDRAGYDAGRSRWRAYERDVLQARLDQRTGTRRPVQPMEYGSLGGGTRTAIRAAGAVASLAGIVLDVSAGTSADRAFDDLPDARYCWPPTDTR